jgi:hypothetical protein
MSKSLAEMNKSGDRVRATIVALRKRLLASHHKRHPMKPLAIALLLLATTSAQAQYYSRNQPVLPPVEYDHPYTGDLTVSIVSQEEIARQCPNAKARLGCNRRWPDECLVWIAPDDVIEALGLTREVVLRHEIGHCNGWPSDHPGMRARTSYSEWPHSKP